MSRQNISPVSSSDSGSFQVVDQLVDDVLGGKASRRQILKRATALGLGAPAIAALFAAGPHGFRSATAQTGRLTVASNQSDAAPRERMENLTQRFESESGVQVQLDTVNHEDFKVAIRTYLVSDNPPDILTWFAGNRMRFFTDRGLVQPITDLYEEQGWDEHYPDGIKAVSRGNDGEYYFFPISYYAWAIYYRPSLFEQAGIEAVPRTWDELLAACDALSEAGIRPFTLGSLQPWTTAAWFDYLNMRVNGPEFHVQLTDGNASYDSPEVVEVFEYWEQLLERNAFIDNPESLLWQDAITPMYQGEAAMYLMGNFIRDSYPEDGVDDLDFFRFPIINPDMPVGEDAPTDGYFIAAGAQNVEEAKAFLAFAGELDVALELALAAGQIAIDTRISLDEYEPHVQQAARLLQESDYIAQFYDRDTLEEMASLGMAGFQEFMFDPSRRDDILSRLERDRQRIFAEAEAEAEDLEAEG